MRLVFATRQPPVPDDTGARIRSHRLLVGLARHMPTTLVTFAHGAASGEHSLDPGAVRDALPGVEVVSVPGASAPRRVRQVRSIGGPGSWEWGRYALPSMRRAIAGHARPGVLVHLDDPGVALAAAGLTSATAFAPHNIEHRIVRDASRAGGGARRAFGSLDWRRLRREERRLWRQATVCVAVSELDAETMRAGGARRILVCPNGTDARAPQTPHWRAPGDPLRVLFVGATSYEPYRQGLRWFIESVLPLLRETVDVRFTVVGGRPRDALEAPGVDYAGRVEDLEPCYQRAHVAVVPVFQGSGTRLKIPEAISYSRPVVSTRLGAEGLPVRAGEHYLAADRADEFAGALREIAEGLEARSDSLARMLDDARAAIEPLLWPRIADELAAAYQRLAAESSVAASASTRSSSR